MATPSIPACTWCKLNRKHAALVAAYDTWAAYRTKGVRREAAIYALLAKHRIQSTPAELAHHMAHHEQRLKPVAMSDRVARGDDRQAEAERWLESKPDAAQILQLVAQSGEATTEQIHDLIYRLDATGRMLETTPEGRLFQIRETLNEMHYRFIVARVPLGSRPVTLAGRRRADVVFQPGPVGTAYWRAQRCDLPQEPFLKTPSGDKRLNRMTLAHNLALLDAKQSIARAAMAEDQPLKNRSVRVSVNPRNWFASHMLGVRFQRPAHTNEYGEARAAEARNMWPDGLLVLEVETVSVGLGQPAPDDPAKAFCLPALLEYDTGSRTLIDVTEQLLAYVALAGTTNQRGLYPVAARFPQLAVDGYRVPVVMICVGGSSTALTEGSGWGRARNLRREAQELKAARGLEGAPPVLLTTLHDWLRDGLQAPTIDLWDQDPGSTWRESRRPLLAALTRSSRALIEGGKFRPGDELQVFTANSRARRAELNHDDTELNRAQRKAKHQALADAGALSEQAELQHQADLEQRNALLSGAGVGVDADRDLATSGEGATS